MGGAPRYLLALYIAEQRRSPPIPPGDVAATLDRSPSTTTEAFQRLADEGLVSTEPYRGVELTERGRERAATLHETYVTVSWFFRSVLDLDDHEAEAMELAGLLSPTVADRLATALPCEPDGPSPAGPEGETRAAEGTTPAGEDSR